MSRPNVTAQRIGATRAASIGVTAAGNEAAGLVLTTDGAGGSSFQTPSGGGGTGGVTTPDWYTWDGHNDRVIADLNFAISGMTSGGGVNGQYPTMAALDSTRALIVYRDSSLGWRAVVVTVNVSTASASPGTPLTLSSSPMPSGSDAVRVVKIDTDKCLVAWYDGTSSLKAAVLSVSGTTVTVGTEATVTSSSLSTFNGMVKIGTGKVALAYADSTGRHVVALSVSGTTITVGSASSALSSGQSANGFTLLRVTDDKFIVLLSNISTGQTEYYMVTVSGTTLTVNASQQLINGVTGWTAAEGIDISATQMLLYLNDNGSGQSRFYDMGISGNTATLADTAGRGSQANIGSPGFALMTAAGVACVGIVSGFLAKAFMVMDTTTHPNVPLTTTYLTTNLPASAGPFHPGMRLQKLDASTALLLYAFNAGGGSGGSQLKLYLMRL